MRNLSHKPGNPLPLGWRWAKIGDIARVFAGGPAPQESRYYQSSGPKFIRVSDIGAGRNILNFRTCRDRLSSEAVTSFPLVKAPAGTLLFPKSGAAIATNSRALLGEDAYFVSHLMGISPNDSLHSEWLFWWMSKIDMMEFSDNSAYPSLKQSVVERINIPLPPMAEQKRISAILKEIMAAIEKAGSAAEAQLEATRALPAAYLYQAFPKEGQNLPLGWRWATLRDVCEELYRYPSLYGLEHLPVGVPVIRGEHIDDRGEISADNANYWHISQAISSTFPRTILRTGDIIFTVRGTIGKVGLVRESHDGSQLSPNLIRISPSNKVSSTYLWRYLTKLRKSDEAVKDNAVTVATVRATDLEKIQIPLAPKHDQDMITALLDDRIAAAEKLRNNIEKQLFEIDALPAALLKRAFSGEL